MGVWVTFVDQSRRYFEDGEAYTIEDDYSRDNGREESDDLMVLDTYGNEIERFHQTRVSGVKVERLEDDN
jgi:hypothetical protein